LRLKASHRWGAFLFAFIEDIAKKENKAQLTVSGGDRSVKGHCYVSKDFMTI